MPETEELPLIHDPRESLEKHFGFREFLSGQEPIVSAILAGKDTLAIMPTGGGKSLCFQLPAMVMDGLTIVVSPLIALMKDQVDSLVKKGVPATALNSTLSPLRAISPARRHSRRQIQARLRRARAFSQQRIFERAFKSRHRPVCRR